MKNKTKRILIGLVFPVVIIVLVCSAFFYKNAYKYFVTDTEKTTQEKVPSEGTITLTKGNWEEYFEYAEEYVQIKNEEGNVEKICLDAYYKMKDEYYEKLVSTSEDVILILDVDDTFKQYEILDPVSGEWKLTGEDSKYESDFYKMHMSGLGDERTICYWYSDTNKCDVTETYFYDDVQNEMILQVINEMEIRAVEGQITLK